MKASTRRIVRDRAAFVCEYCQLPESALAISSVHEIEHIVAKKHHGDDSLENLALACFHCNSHKGSNLTGIDPASGEITVLFHPRQHVWDEHFDWEGLLVVGKTSIGRVTVDVLCMNAAAVIELREAIAGDI